MGIASFVVGVLAGLLGLFGSLRLGALGRVATRLGADRGETAREGAALTLVLSLAGILGAGLALRYPTWGGVLLAVAGVALIAILRQAALVAGGLLLVAAVLAFLSAAQRPAVTTRPAA